MDSTPFTRTTLRMFSGVIVWAAHFGTIYAAAALACALGLGITRWTGISLTSIIVTATVIALGVTLAFVAAAVRAGLAAFENWMTAAVGLLAALAIVWEGLVPVFIVPACV